MSWQLRYTPEAVKDIAKLDSVAKKRLQKALERFATDPLHYAKKLVNPHLGTYRFRVGDHRVIFDLHQREIIILRAGHRREIYL